MDSIKIRSLEEKINLKLDSIVKDQTYSVVDGYKYYRFSNGVFVEPSDTILIGAFGYLDRVHFVSHRGHDSFICFDETGECSEKTLEQLLFAVEEGW